MFVLSIYGPNTHKQRGKPMIKKKKGVAVLVIWRWHLAMIVMKRNKERRKLTKIVKPIKYTTNN
uniref:Uncharacterized protein n=1 Tax=Rhizophora mucronata TaxID=61149 RepID=A0A2P2PPM0_RHIMU